MSLNRTLIILLCLVIMPVYCQKKPPNLPIRLESYFTEIKRLVDNQTFPSLESLLEKRKRSNGEERVDASLELYIHYIFKSTEIAKKYNDEAYELAATIGYDKGYLRSSLNQAFISFVQGEFDSALDIIDYVETSDKCEFFSNIEADSETLKSYIFAIIGAEYILNWLPVGTHDWFKFIEPKKLQEICKCPKSRRRPTSSGNSFIKSLI